MGIRIMRILIYFKKWKLTGGFPINYVFLH